jgi:hypothetical protein
MFWMVGQSEPLSKIETAHEQTAITNLTFHPMGYMMTTSENHCLVL